MVGVVGRVVPPSRFVTGREVARMFGVSVSTVRGWADGGRLEIFYGAGGRGRLYLRSEVLELFRASCEEE